MQSPRFEALRQFLTHSGVYCVVVPTPHQAVVCPVSPHPQPATPTTPLGSFMRQPFGARTEPKVKKVCQNRAETLRGLVCLRVVH